jgi:hypothetical protein
VRFKGDEEGVSGNLLRSELSHSGIPSIHAGREREGEGIHALRLRSAVECRTQVTHIYMYAKQKSKNSSSKKELALHTRNAHLVMWEVATPAHHEKGKEKAQEISAPASVFTPATTVNTIKRKGAHICSRW